MKTTMVQTDLFLTHDWGTDELGRNNHERVARINDELKKLGYITWFDEDRMVGNIVQQMCDGIENTKIVLVFVTQRYYGKVTGTNPSDNCKLEFEHASRQKTKDKMIAIIMETRMKDSSSWKGIIGMYLGGNMYIDMSGDLDDQTYMKTQLSKLEKELNGIGKTPDITTTAHKKDVNGADVKPVIILKPMEEDCLNAHNLCRSKHAGTPSVQWSVFLAEEAQKWADKVAADRNMVYSPKKERPGQGERICSYEAGRMNGKKATELWYGQIKDFDFTNKESRPLMTGNFSQVVWKESVEIGAGFSTSGERDYCVVRYSVAGNVKGMYEKNIGDLVDEPLDVVYMDALREELIAEGSAKMASMPAGGGGGGSGGGAASAAGGDAPAAEEEKKEENKFSESETESDDDCFGSWD